ncbi:MAG: hypothetical protein MZV63_67010 [Marinilabiliales bacterium]|nr:hypothetical protein [Marinilabiliales bacterium]
MKRHSLVKIEGLQVKTSRALLGEIHDLNVARLDDRFGVTGELFKTIKIKSKKIKKMLAGRHGRIFFRHGMPEGYVDNDANLSALPDLCRCLSPDDVRPGRSLHGIIPAVLLFSRQY